MTLLWSLLDLEDVIGLWEAGGLEVLRATAAGAELVVDVEPSLLIFTLDEDGWNSCAKVIFFPFLKLGPRG